MLGGGLDVFINFLRVEPDINYTHVGWGTDINSTSTHSS